MDVRFEEAIFQADQDAQEGQLIGGGGGGELDGGVKRVDVFKEHIQTSGVPVHRRKMSSMKRFHVSWLRGPGCWPGAEPPARP